ncbi:MAG: hypothetical protein A3K19_28050 [Lentisphaerae bacterium RIFOXYB12_FULL_65_16]|nr:MAG: hypothetical protein A3K18_27875 [Lentisphaerae bacterium RIFOXYA12_64_32]OGV88144.1 MAG: hypothetical protein A3K19_28050 [Lentisphaerae bacterium RIFOXYB12_FULL_65_16]
MPKKSAFRLLSLSWVCVGLIAAAQDVGPIPAGPDLALGPKAAVGVRHVVVSAFDPVLLRLVASDAGKVAMRHQALRDVHAYPAPVLGAAEPGPDESASGATGEPSDPVLPEPDDVVVELVFSPPPPPDEMDAVASAAAKALAVAWYAVSAHILPEPWTGAGNTILPSPVRHIGLRLAPLDVAKTYWAIVVPASAAVPPVLDPAVASVRPVPAVHTAVQFTRLASESGRADGFVTFVAVPVGAGETHLPVEGFLEKLGGTEEAVAVIDPLNRIPEVNEENNRVFVPLHGQPWTPPPPAADLFPVGERTVTRIVSCTATADNPVLLELLRQSATHALAERDGFRAVHVVAWPRRAVGIDRILDFPATLDFDLVVMGAFAGQAEGVDAAMVALAKQLTSEWYVAGADVVGMREGWSEQRRFPEVIVPRQVGAVVVKLADTDEVRRYWRVAVPVVRRTLNAGPMPGPLAIRPLIGAVDQVAENTATDTADGLRRPDFMGAAESLLVAVAFTGEFALTDGGSASARADDHVWVAPDGRSLAVALLAMPGAPSGGEARVDPDNAVAEFDETNNVCRVPGVSLPPPPARFDARAWIATPAADDATANTSSAAGKPVLVVAGELRNLSDQEIHLVFPSSLQMDFRFSAAYQWSADKVFAQHITDVLVGPGSSMTWTLRAPMSEIGWDGTPTPVEVFLAGTTYRDVVPFPAGTDPTGPADSSARPAGDEPDAAAGPPRPPVIVGPDGVDFDVITGPVPAGLEPPGLAKEARGGGLETDSATGVVRYQPGEGFLGADYMVLDGTDGGVRRLNVGLQTFRLTFVAGWNLISFPVRPLATLDELLAQVPRAVAWVWRDGAYCRAAEVRVGEAVWLYSATDVELEYLGEPEQRLELSLDPGWHLVGAVNGGDFSRQPGIRAALGWNGAGYRSISSNRSGTGAWLLVDRPVSLDVK